MGEQAIYMVKKSANLIMEEKQNDLERKEKAYG